MNFYILSDDARMAADLEALCQRHPHLATARCLRIPPGQQLPRDVPQALLFDLRLGDDWLRLPQTHRRLSSRQQHAAVTVGIVERGYPLESAAEADHTLDLALQWPPDDIELELLASGLQSGPQTQTRRDTKARLVRGWHHQFGTYTPTLFPVLEDVEIAACQDFTILLYGETGTGKTTLARVIHELSIRRDEPFITVACASLSPELVGSELFGHVKGAFTGAERTKDGKFEAAGRGTLLLDEIDLLGPMQQANLLRVLESGEYEPVGSNETRITQARTIVACNVGLKSLLDQGLFRADLYYRLSQVNFEIPPLRERPLDIVPLAVQFIEDCCRQEGLHVDYLELDFLRALKTYAWPGNIRELRNEVRRAVLFHANGVVRARNLSTSLQQRWKRELDPKQSRPTASKLCEDVARTEKDTIVRSLQSHNFNRAATARALGISRVTLYNKIRKYNIRLQGSDANHRRSQGGNHPRAE